MPYEKGGREDKKGNKYEINCIVYELLKVLDKVQNFTIYFVMSCGRKEIKSYEVHNESIG